MTDAMSYTAPVKDMLFCMKELADLEAIAQLPGFEEAGLETAQAVLEECARFNEERARAAESSKATRDRRRWKDGVVTTTPGFKQAFRAVRRRRLAGPAAPGDFGGQGLPKTIGAACIEMINSANLSFALCPLLTDGAIEALLTAGSARAAGQLHPEDDLRRVDRHDEPDRAAGRLRPGAGAHPRRAASATAAIKLFGTKIFITYGEHDMAENIVHLVLARVAGAPEGVKGISLFVVPEVPRQRRRLARRAQRRLVRQHRAQARHQGQPDGGAPVRRRGRPGARRAWRDRHLVGEENRGLEYMFIMMNAARYAVGVQGIAVAERAYQQAAAFAKERVQSRPVDGSVARQRDDHPPPRRAAHADDDARLHRGLPGAGDRRRRRRSTPRTTTPTRTRASRTRPSTNSWCRWSRATAPR